VGYQRIYLRNYLLKIHLEMLLRRTFISDMFKLAILVVDNFENVGIFLLSILYLIIYLWLLMVPMMMIWYTIFSNNYNEIILWKNYDLILKFY